MALSKGMGSVATHGLAAGTGALIGAGAASNHYLKKEYDRRYGKGSSDEFNPSDRKHLKRLLHMTGKEPGLMMAGHKKAASKKPSVETMPHKEGPIKHEGKGPGHPAETGLKTTETGSRIPREVKSLADRMRAKDPDMSDSYAYATAWKVYKKHTPEGRKYTTIEKAGSVAAGLHKSATMRLTGGTRVAVLGF